MKTARLSTSESLMLDVIRCVAAGAVAFGHLTQPFFSTGWPNLIFVARSAVAVFFLLSGFVIRYVTCRKPATLGHYLGDRASRIYSVAIPALLFAYIADTISLHVNPAFFEIWRSSYTHPFLNIAANLLFCGQLWAHIISPFTAGPFWSVNYEVAYYLLYGCWFYITGIQRWFWIVIISIVYGPRVLYLAPLWILGCGLHDLYQYWTNPDASTARSTALTVASLGVLIAFFGIVCVRAAHGQTFGPAVFNHISKVVNVRQTDYLFGLLWSFAFLLLLFIARQFSLAQSATFVRAAHFISEGTFPIYLLHFPLYVLIASCIPYNHASSAQKLIIFFSVMTVGVLAGHPCNLLKLKIRSLIFQS